LSDLITLSSAALDCPDARELAAFYAEITGGRVIFESDAWATVDGPGGRIDFQTVHGYTPPAWPDATSSIQMHLDFYVEDLAATEARVLAAGARRFEFQPNSDHCFVFADPVGHPFRLSTWGNLAASTDDGVSRPTAEIVALLASLDGQRDHVLGILEGLDEAALRRPVLPSGWTCLGLVQHLAVDVERFWFRDVVAGEAAVGRRLADRHRGPDRGGFRRLPRRDRTSQRDHHREASGHRAGLLAHRPVRRVAAR
jgi:catechol 2,3-dioxygenase-like lactoylglutathione lyase family enzyme